MAERYSKRLLRGHRPRKLYNQLLTAATMYGPGSGVRVLASRLKGAKIGEQCWIGDNVTIDIHYAHPERAESLIIEDRVAVGPSVKLFTHDTSSAHITGGRIPVKFGKTVIGHDSWIGAGAVVANCKVGHHCIIAPNSLVSADVADYSLVMGVPGKVVKNLRERVGGAAGDPGAGAGADNGSGSPASEQGLPDRSDGRA